MQELDQIPTVDFTEFLKGDPNQKQEAADRLGETLQYYGFASLIGHQIPRHVIDDAFAASESFFRLEESEKLRLQDKRNNRGYIPLFDSTTVGQRPSGLEAFSIGHFTQTSNPALKELPFYAETPWPELADFKERVEPFHKALYALGAELMSAVAMHLGKPANFFADISSDTYSNMRLIHYPPQEKVADTADFGVNAHVDRGLLTLLVQDQNGGLSVFSPQERWLPVVPDPDAIVVNVGSLLRHWTNGRYAAALHRVINSSGRERYSMPLFVHPSYYTRIDTVTLVGEMAVSKDFEPIVAGESVFEGFARDRPSWKKEPA